MKKMLAYQLLIILSIFSFQSCKPKEPSNGKIGTVNVTYQPSDAQFPNPERGFYKYSEINVASGSGALSQAQLSGYRQNNITLVYRNFYLKKFKDAALTQQALDEIDRDFVTARNAGVKVIVRFAYSSAPTEPDAPLSTIQLHLDQLKPILNKHADVIAVVQAGFIGAWGEWYYTTNNLNTDGARYEVIKKLLECTPVSRAIQLRTPAYKKQYFQRSTPLTYQEAFKGTDISRVGHHNDCFLAGPTDYGTYINPTEDKAYLNKDCLFVPIGGETCPPDGVDPASSSKAQSEMRYLRWSYLNEDYYRPVNEAWRIDGGMDNILRELGYRLRLSSGDYTNKVMPGGVFNARTIIRNLGYAPLYNERLVELILKNTKSGEKYKLRLKEIEPRLWQPLADNEIIAEAGIPQSMPEGDYELYLNLPAPESSLYANPDYSVRLANENVWEAATGYNKLNVVVNVSAKNKTAAYSGSFFFEK